MDFRVADRVTDELAVTLVARFEALLKALKVLGPRILVYWGKKWFL